MTPRVLLCGRPDLLSKPGGDTRQILTLHQHLGGASRLSLQLRPALRGVDVVHVFNLSRPLEPAVQAEHARRAGLPVVCTPIYQDLREYNRRGRYGAGRLLFRLLGRDDRRLEDLRALVNLTRAGAEAPAALPLLARACARHLPGAGDRSDLQQRVLESATTVVFNSRLEAETVQRSNLIRELPPSRQAIAPLGVVPEELEQLDPGPFVRRFGVEGFVLSVARLEDLKNQLALIRALEGEPVPLVLVGQPNRLHRGYCRAVQAAARARPRTLLLRLDRPLLLSAMAAAAVHALPSWFETAGLTSLEAAVAGCVIVSTDRGYARAYLGDDAIYCSPCAPDSIRSAVLQARGARPSAALRQRILSRFTVAHTAAAMQQIYERAAA